MEDEEIITPYLVYSNYDLMVVKVDCRNTKAE